MIKKLILTLSLGICLAAPIGCATTPGGKKDLAPLVKTAAYVGTTYALKAHPEYRPGFELALAQLETLEQSETIDFVTLLAIVNRLPVTELKSDEATLIVTSATLLLSEYGGGVLPVEQLEKARPIAVALRSGIALALK